MISGEPCQLSFAAPGTLGGFDLCHEVGRQGVTHSFELLRARRTLRVPVPGLLCRRVDIDRGELRRDLIARHLAETGSPRATDILRNWDEALPRFRQVAPKEMLNRLEHPLSDAAEAEAATA